MDLMTIVFFVSLVIIITGALHKKMQDLFLTEPLLAMLCGIALGPDVLDLIRIKNETQEFEILKIACEFTMAMALMATALRIPGGFLRKNLKTMTGIIGPGMLLMWMFSSAILYLIPGKFSIEECLLLGAIITPTDPVIAATIVTGEKAKKYLPASIRNTLSYEAGINDGLAFPIVALSIFLVSSSSFPLEKWVTQTLLYETLLCGILAYAIGVLGGKLMHKAHKKGYMDEKSLLPYSVALALLLLGGLEAIKMNGIIGVFIGGLGFSKDITGNEDMKEERVQEAMERIFTIPAFFIFGMMLPWHEWYSMKWSALGIIVLVMLFRRLPAFFSLKPLLPLFRKKSADIAVMGWFGPIGIAALYYAIHSKEKAHFDEAWIIPSLVVFASTIIHGLSSVPVEKLYFRKSGRKKKGNGS